MSAYVVLYTAGRGENRWSLGFPKAVFAGREGRTFSLYLKNEEATESE